MINQERKFRVVSFINRSELDLLDTLIKDIYFSYGVKISRERIIAEIISMFRDKYTQDEKALEDELLKRVKGKKQDRDEERRRFLRMPAGIKIDYKLLESLQEPLVSQAKNISEMGIQVELAEYFEPNTVLELKLQIEENAAPVSAFGRVKWVKKHAGGRGYTTGICLVHIADKDKQIFGEYIDKMRKTYSIEQVEKPPNLSAPGHK